MRRPRRRAWAWLIALTVLGTGGGCSATTAGQGAAPPVAETSGSSGQSASIDPAFIAWRDGVRAEALAAGIAAPLFDRAFADVQPIPKILELDRKQPEFTLTFEEYVGRTVTQSRVDRGRKLLVEHAAALQKASDRFGVQPRFIVALWGIESGFGRSMGGYPVIAALATLAYDGRRSAYFRKELMAALKILQSGDIAPEAMKGSWAGAMGQSQFMPSSFLKYATDGDGDGKRDIWGDADDVFASIGSYLATVGWRADQNWGRAVRIPDAGIDPELLGLGPRKSLAEWQALGIRRDDGGDLPARPITASLIQVRGPGSPYFLVYDNFRTIMDWNRSFLFATTVGILADRLSDG